MTANDREQLAPGARVGDRYRVERRIGEGGFGTVYAAVREVDGARVALKILAAELACESGSEARFRREAELASRLGHPNAVRVLDHGRDESGRSFIAFELLEGRSLDALIAVGPLAPERAAAITIEVLDALAEAHAIGIVHRDLKPSNVFLVGGPAQSVKVLDFGIAKSMNPGTVPGLTQTGVLLGTPAYMAPEQIAGLPTGPATDLYALGIVLAEMLLGRSLVPAEAEPLELLRARLRGDPLPVPPALRATPLGAIVRRATSSLQSERYASAAEMRAALVAVSTERVAATATADERVAATATADERVAATATADLAFARTAASDRTLAVAPTAASDRPLAFAPTAASEREPSATPAAGRPPAEAPTPPSRPPAAASCHSPTQPDASAPATDPAAFPPREGSIARVRPRPSALRIALFASPLVVAAIAASVWVATRPRAPPVPSATGSASGRSEAPVKRESLDAFIGPPKTREPELRACPGVANLDMSALEELVRPMGWTYVGHDAVCSGAPASSGCQGGTGGLRLRNGNHPARIEILRFADESAAHDYKTAERARRAALVFGYDGATLLRLDMPKPEAERVLGRVCPGG